MFIKVCFVLFFVTVVHVTLHRDYLLGSWNHLREALRVIVLGLQTCIQMFH